MGKGDVRVAIIGDASSVQRAFGEADASAGKFESSWKRTMGVLGGAVGGAAILNFMGDSITAGSDLSETMSKSATVFGQANAAVIALGESSAKTLGMSKNEAMAAAANYGNLFRAMGLTENASAGMSVEMVKLASDMASFNNTKPEEALDALRSGLVGETEPLRRFGVQLSAARVESEAMAMGLGGVGRELTAAEKAQAAYAIIMKDTNLTQGDFAKTSEGLANQTRVAQAEFENLKAQLGEKLIPVVLDLKAKFEDLIGWWTENIGDGEDLSRGWAKLHGWLVDIGNWWTENIGTMDDFKAGLTKLGDAVSWVGDKFGWVKDHVLDPFVGSVQTASNLWGDLSNKIGGSGVTGVFGFAYDKVSGNAQGGFLQDGWSMVGENGPELAYTRGGKTSITPNQQSQGATAGAQVLNLTIPVTLGGENLGTITRRLDLAVT